MQRNQRRKTLCISLFYSSTNQIILLKIDEIQNPRLTDILRIWSKREIQDYQAYKINILNIKKTVLNKITIKNVNFLQIC